jgi:hypothetical protein
VILSSIFVAAAVVTLLHYGRDRGRRALPLAAMFAFLALARASGDGDRQFWADLLAGASGLAHLALLVPRHAPEKEARPAVAKPSS